MLTRAIAPQLLQAIARRNAEVLEPFSRVDQTEFAQHDAVQVGWKAPHGLAPKQPLGIAIGETVNHCR